MSKLKFRHTHGMNMTVVWTKSEFRPTCTGEESKMNKTISIAMLAAGILLTIFGIGASKSFSSDLSRFFTGAPDRARVGRTGGHQRPVERIALFPVCRLIETGYRWQPLRGRRCGRA